MPIKPDRAQVLVVQVERLVEVKVVGVVVVEEVVVVVVRVQRVVVARRGRRRMYAFLADKIRWRLSFIVLISGQHCDE